MRNRQPALRYYGEFLGKAKDHDRAWETASYWQVKSDEGSEV